MNVKSFLVKPEGNTWDWWGVFKVEYSKKNFILALCTVDCFPCDEFPWMNKDGMAVFELVRKFTSKQSPIVFKWLNLNYGDKRLSTVLDGTFKATEDGATIVFICDTRLRPLREKITRHLNVQNEQDDIVELPFMRGSNRGQSCY